MDCPDCGLANPSNADRCDCGYVFKTQTDEEDIAGIRYSVRQEDLVTIGLHHGPSSPMGLPFRFYLLPAFLAVIGLLFYFKSPAFLAVIGVGNLNDIDNVPLVGTLFPTLALAAFVMLRWIAKHGQFPSSIYEFFPHKQSESLTAETLHHLAAEEESLLWDGHRFNWSAFEKAVTTPDYAFFYMRNIVGQFIVPQPGNPSVIWGLIVASRRSVVSGDYDDFLRRVRERVDTEAV